MSTKKKLCTIKGLLRVVDWLQGVQMSTKKKLCTIKGLLLVVDWLQGVQMSTKKKLCTIKGLSEAKVDKIKEVTVKLSGVTIIIIPIDLCSFLGYFEITATSCCLYFQVIITICAHTVSQRSMPDQQIFLYP